MKILRLFLFPFSLIYGVIIILRNTAYDLRLFSSKKYDIPVIGVGNLVVGGVGKSPMVEHIVRLLKNHYKIATLSRGYGRKTKGFRLVEPYSTAQESGDEPLQFKTKFPDITVSVCEDRKFGIEQIKNTHDVIIMDDAFQHRAVTPGLSILLFDYFQFFNWQWMLPTGDLREPLFARKRADIIVVTKTPKELSETEKQRILYRLNPNPKQAIFFSHITYNNMIHVDGHSERRLNTLSDRTSIILLTGIANPIPLLNELKQYDVEIIHHHYPDHHPYTRKNIIKLAEEFRAVTNADKLILTTEKDMQRLRTSPDFELLSTFPVYHLPISACIHGQEEQFNRLIQNYVTKHSNHNRIY